MDAIPSGQTCPNCDGRRTYAFHHIANVPVNSCLLYENRKGATNLRCGNIDLSFCPDCGFVYNTEWRPDQTTYGDHYEDTQEFSGTFSAYQKQQAIDLLARYGVVEKEIVDIGCGKGEFLSLLCELGRNRGVGYDPSFVTGRRNGIPSGLEFKRELFTAATNQSPPDLVCCKMTLEHISASRQFVRSIRKIASPKRGTVVCIQVPDVRRILSEAAFWDVYYEHCSYFSPSSLQRVLRESGFEVLRVESGFGGQYLTIEARAVGIPPASANSQPEAADDLESAVAQFSDMAARSIAAWKKLLHQTASMGRRSVLWGSGSKAVAFMSAVGNDAEIEYLIDINPYRWGKFVPGSGKQIMPPEVILKHPPDLVIAMNPNYIDEISSSLSALGCSTAMLLALGVDSPQAVHNAIEAPRTEWANSMRAAN